MKIKVIIFLVFTCILYSQTLNSGLFNNVNDNAKISFRVSEYNKNSIVIEADIPDGYYTYIDSKIANKIIFSSKDIDITTVYPDGIKKDEDIVLYGSVKFVLNSKKELERGEYTIEARYQLCIEKDNICLRPETDSISFYFDGANDYIENVSSDTNTKEDNAISYSAMPSNASAFANSISYIKGGGNIFLILLIIFLAGIGSVLLPCTYPILSITISILGGDSKTKERSEKKNILYSLFFCFGIITTYTLLGAIVSLAGFIFHTTIMFGSISYNPIVLSVLVFLFLYFAFSMSGFYDIKTPSFLQSAKSKAYIKKDGSIFHKYVMGLLAGIVATPCAAPIIAVILEIGFLNPVYAVVYMATYAIGFSLVLFILGTFVSLLSKLPKAGSWMVYIKYIFAFIMFLISFYYLHILFTTIGSGKLSSLFSALIILAFATVVYIITRKRLVLSGFEVKIFITVLILSLAIGLVYGSVRSFKSESNGVTLDSAIDISKRTGKYILIDFSAVWCANCFELRERVLENEILKGYIEENYIFVEIDVDKNKELAEKYDVRWLPWITVIDSSGNIKYVKNSFDSFNDNMALKIKNDLENLIKDK